MILKGSQRGGASKLARHLLRVDENEHVHVEQTRGFVATDLHGALAEAEAVAKGTKCKQHLFSLSLNPPKEGNASREDLMKAADEAERRLGLAGCPRIIVTHEKNGRLHAHAVWSRIDSEKMTAVNLPFFKSKLAELSKDLFIEHGWELPAGHKQKGDRSPLNFDLGEWQQAKRVGRDPREMKALFQDAWKNSDDLKSFKERLEEKGFFLAKGDRRRFIAIDIHGEVYSVARMLGLPVRVLEARLGDGAQLPGAGDVQRMIKSHIKGNVAETIKAMDRRHRRELAPLQWQRRQVVRAQRVERVQLTAKHARPSKRPRMAAVVWQTHQPIANVKATSGHAGSRPVSSDLRTGELAPLIKGLPSIRQQFPGEPWEAYQNYRREVQRQFEKQLDELKALQAAIEKMRTRQIAERLAMIARIALVMRLQRDGERNARENRPHQLVLEF